MYFCDATNSYIIIKKTILGKYPVQFQPTLLQELIHNLQVLLYCCI